MPAMTNARRNAVIGIVVAAVLGSIISTLGGDGGEELGGLPTFAWLVIIAFVVNIAVFVPSFLAKTEHYYDLTGSLTYLTVTLVALATTTDRDLRTVLLAAMIVLWRLGSAPSCSGGSPEMVATAASTRSNSMVCASRWPGCCRPSGSRSPPAPPSQR